MPSSFVASLICPTLSGSDVDSKQRTDTAAWEELHSALPDPASPGAEDTLVEREFTAQFHWYDRQARRTRVGYQSLRVGALVVGAAVTVLAASAAPPALTASLAAAVVVIEGVQQVFQLQRNWISYRRSAEGLRLQWFRYAARLAPYDDPATRSARLGHALEEVTSMETTGWARTMRSSPSKSISAH